MYLVQITEQMVAKGKTTQHSDLVVGNATWLDCHAGFPRNKISENQTAG
jgi:hypothetical protein